MCYNNIIKVRGGIMEISKKALIATLLINIFLIAAGVACVIIMDFSVLALSLFTAISIFVLFSSVMAYSYSKGLLDANTENKN